MLKFTVEGVSGFELSEDAKNWLTKPDGYLIEQWNKSKDIIQWETRENNLPFDSNLLFNLHGRIHVKLYPNEFLNNDGSWYLAGRFTIAGGPYDPDIDGGGFCDLIEASWHHEYEKRIANDPWDTLEHEIGHFYKFRLNQPNWHVYGHGKNTGDPCAFALENRVNQIFPRTQVYYPQEIINMMSLPKEFKENKLIHACGTVI